jgi:predicted RNA-binding protein with PIN domain
MTVHAVDDEAHEVAPAVAPALAPGVGPSERVRDVAALPDAALRRALEYVVLIVNAGQKTRPPIAYPPALKPLLKMQRLDRVALHTARRVVAGDDELRDRLALGATEELLDDEIGRLWLRRPDGWDRRVLELHEAAKHALEHASSEQALKRSERRREAAEQVAARAQAELLSQQEALGREQAAHERAESDLAQAQAQVKAMRQEIAGLHREIERLRELVATESDRADQAMESIVEAREQLRAAEEVRDRVLGDRVAERRGPALDAPPSAAPAPSAPATNEQAARALQQAAAATRELAIALASAADAVGAPSAAPPAPQILGGSLVLPGPPTSGSQIGGSQMGGSQLGGSQLGSSQIGARPRSSKPNPRKPLAIPGGLYGDSLAAATHLLQAPDALVIVDGYNVAKLAWPTFELNEQRGMCVDMLEDLARRQGTEIRVIFDGAEVVGATATGRRLIHVQYSPAGVSADDVIRAEVRNLPSAKPVIVVTNDQAIVNDVRVEGANVVASDMLLAVAGRPVKS